MPFFAASDGALLHYAEAGEGLPVLALAGLTRAGGDFDHLAPHLAAAGAATGPARLIRLDARGRGRSAFTDPATYTVAQEAEDALGLLDHLGIGRAAVLGTSRGGLVGMAMAAGARPRLLGLALNDVGPAIDPAGLRAIEGYIGRNPAQATHEEAAEARARLSPAFRGVPPGRWLAEARNHYEAADGRLRIRYDPRLRDAFLAAGPVPDLWPLFDALAGLPLCCIRGEGSDILGRDTFEEMRRRRPDMVAVEVPGRGHVPFLDEPEALAALRDWLRLCRRAAAAG